jgi:transposase
MLNREEQIRDIKTKYKHLEPLLNERARRIWCASEAKVLGHGGAMIVHQATQVSRATIHKGLGELKADKIVDPERIRRNGGGRKRITEKDPTLLKDLDAMIDPATRGNPENPLRWSSKSTLKLAEELNKQGYKISHSTVHTILKSQGFSLKANKKTNEGLKDHPDRDAQFQFINDKTNEFQKENNPVLSVDTKKKKT